MVEAGLETPSSQVHILCHSCDQHVAPLYLQCTEAGLLPFLVTAV